MARSFRKKTLSDDQQSNIEVNKIIDGVSKVEFGGGVIFDNPITNASVESYGGISQLSWDLNPENDKQRESTWVRKELKEIWLSCKYDCKQSCFPSYKSSGNTLHYIGNEVKCKELLEQSNNKQIEQNSNDILTNIVSDLSNKFTSNMSQKYIHDNQ